MKNLLFTAISLLFVQFSNAQWVEQGCGYTDPYGLVYSVSIPETGVIWLGMEQDGWNNYQRMSGRSVDDGLTWTFNEIDTLSEYICLKVKGINADTAFASLIKSPVEDSSKIYRTVDGGQSWDLIPTAFNGAYEACIDFHFFDANEGVAFGAPLYGPMTVYRTLDGGDTWAKVQAANLPVPLVQEGMGIFSGNGSYGAVGDNIWFGTTKGRTYKSTDRGVNWTASEIDTTITIHSVDFRDESNGVCVSLSTAFGQSFIPNRVFTTSDGGVTWVESMNVGSNPRMGLVRHLPGTADSYITTYGRGLPGKGTQVSTDGGITWTVHSTERIVGADFLSGTYGWGGGVTSTLDKGIFKWDGISSNEELTSSNIKVYPTLTSEKITIEGGTISQVKCLDQMGREVAVQLTGNSIQIDHLANGVYSLLIDSEGVVSRHSFVVNKNL